MQKKVSWVEDFWTNITDNLFFHYTMQGCKCQISSNFIWRSWTKWFSVYMISWKLSSVNICLLSYIVNKYIIKILKKNCSRSPSSLTSTWVVDITENRKCIGGRGLSGLSSHQLHTADISMSSSPLSEISLPMDDKSLPLISASVHLHHYHFYH